MTQNNLIEQIVEVLHKHSKFAAEKNGKAQLYVDDVKAAATEIASLMPPPEPNQSESMTVVFKNKQGARKTVAIPVEKLTEHFGDFFYDELENTAPKCNCTNESNSHCECTPIFEDYEIASAFITPAALHPLTKLREEVERLRDEAEKNRAMFARDCNPNYAYQSIGAKEACNHILSLLTQENDGKAFEEAVEEYVLDIMKNNYPKFLSYALSLIGKEIYKTNADEFTFSQEADLAPNQRYKIEMKGTINPLPSLPKSK